MASSNGSGFWNNNAEALSILNPLLALNAPSKEALAQLSTIEAYDNNGPGDSQVASTFLQAAAKHMLIAHTTEDQTGVSGWIDKVAEVRIVDTVVIFFVFLLITPGDLPMLTHHKLSSQEKRPPSAGCVHQYPNPESFWRFQRCTSRHSHQ